MAWEQFHPEIDATGQQTEYVLGGGSSHYLFLVLATENLIGR